MPLTAGTHLGSYKVLAPIGAGGMGEVYQAHDTKLGRDVAIKVLPEAFAHDSERLARFQREAKMLASLNHPNIAAIYGLEQSNATHYLVMELVSGETLADRIKRDRAIPVEEALGLAKQIAEALEAAHEKGIIHRDLKPANVKVTPEGKVKVLDFGLAKAFAGDAVSNDPSESPTLSRAATMQGVILGTAAYMSPEQARNKAVDKRTDIWAFGCVLYELLTGKQAFHGEDVTDILAAVVKTEPDWQALPATTAVQIRNLLRRCLQKDKTLRLQAAGDVRLEIQEALTAPAQEEVTATRHARSWRQVAMFAITALAFLAIGGISVWNLKPTPAPQRPVTRFTISLPAGQRLAGLDDPAIALSPDGTRLAYVAIQGGIQQLYLRAMDSPEVKPILGTEGAAAPFFSPDSQWVGFFAGGKLKKVSVSGGAAVSVADVPGTYRSATWGSDDAILFWSVGRSGIFRVSEAGGTPQTLVASKPEEAVLFPEILPGGKAVLFTAGTSLADPRVAIRSQQTGERRDLIGGMRPSYAPTGHLIYAQGGTLMAVPFDPQRLGLTASPVPVLEGVLQGSTTRIPQYSFSNTGSLAYVAAGSVQGSQRMLVWVDRKGAEHPLPAPSRNYGAAAQRLSPDGRRVAVAIDFQTWLYDLSRETLTRLTFDGGSNTTPIWTPDGKRITVQSTRGGGTSANVWWQMADGSGTAERLTTSDYQHIPSSWSPDGQALAFSEINPTTGQDIWVLRLSDRKAEPFLRTPANEGAPQFSSDGRWLAYVSDESGRREIYVQPYPGPGGKWQISTEGGNEPVWGRDGEIFYRNGDKMMAVDTRTQPTFSAGKPKVLFEDAYVPTLLAAPTYDVSADGQRFVMLKDSELATTQINIVLNWFEELKRRVPPGK